LKTFILGGVKSGKSRYAEQIAQASPFPVTIIATAMAHDDEMSKRIARHKADRPTHWSLIEEPIALGAAIDSACVSGQCVLVDCLTLWLTQVLMQEDEAVLASETQALRKAVDQASGELIIISNENSMGIVPLGELTRRYCDEAGLLHQHIASQCDRAILTVAGLPVMLKGEMPVI